MTVPGLSLQQRVRVLEDQVRQLASELRLARQDTPGHEPPRERWLGRIVDDPDPGDNTFRVHLLSCRFTRATGVQAALEHDRDSYVIARSFPGRSHRRNDRVCVERIRGRLAGEAETGEWWICEGSVEVRWGRIVASAAPVPDLSDTAVKRVLPIYEVELGHVPDTWPAVDRLMLGYGPLDPATNEIDAAISAFVADVPREVVPALSTIGDLHAGQPVLLVDEGGRWVIVGPQQAVETRERIVLAAGYRELDGSYDDYVLAGDRLNLYMTSAYGLGWYGTRDVLSPEEGHDLIYLPQTGFDSPFARVNRRGDYLIAIRWTPKPHNYNFMTGAWDADEPTTVTGATYETRGGDFVDGVLWQNPARWEVLLTLNVFNPLLPRATDEPIQDVAVMRYEEPWGETRQVVYLGSFNKGDELRLILSLSDEHWSPPSITDRGVSGGAIVTIARLASGETWIP